MKFDFWLHFCGDDNMNLAIRITNNVVAIVVSLIFLISITTRLDKSDKKNRIYVLMFIINTIQLITETFTCIIDGRPSKWLIGIATISHMSLFLLGPVIAYLWYRFTYTWVNEDKGLSLIKRILILLPMIINALVVLATPFLNLIFQITPENVYKRSFLFFVPVVTTYFYLFYSLIFVYKNKHKVGQIEFLPLALFCIFPAIGGLIQSLSYGILLMWSTTAFSLIMIFIFLQQRMLQTDQLTGAWMRQKLIFHLNYIIRKKNPASFSIVFVDLDRFKEINDAYGHIEGDKALITVVNLIKANLRKGDFITRYGGDEFVIFLNVESKDEVETIIMRISNLFLKYNKEAGKPYKLGFSYGYELYDINNPMNLDDYIRHVDALMYKAKKEKNCAG